MSANHLHLKTNTLYNIVCPAFITLRRSARPLNPSRYFANVVEQRLGPDDQVGPRVGRGYGVYACVCVFVRSEAGGVKV